MTRYKNESLGLDEYTEEELAQVTLFLNYPDELLSFAAACCGIFMVIGIPGNIITILALSKCRKIRNATAIFIINLSISDLLFSMTVLPLSIVLFANRSWVAGKVMCKFFPAANYFLAAVSLYSIVAITVNRYVMVAHPMHYPRLFQTRNLIIMIIFIWVSSFGLITPTFTEIWGRFSLDTQKAQTCTIIPDRNGNSPKIVLIAVGLVIPTIFMIACYTRILFIVQRSKSKSKSRQITRASDSKNQNITNSSSSTQDDTANNPEQKEVNDAMFKRIKNIFRFQQRRLSNGPTRRDKRLHTMIVVVLLSFFISHVPIAIAKIASKDFSVSPYGTMLGNLILYLTVCSNPVIYVVMSKDYRQAYKSIFR